jgi:hypothetical protein
MYHRVARFPEDAELVPQVNDHVLDPQMARRRRMSLGLRRKELVDMFSPQNRDTSTKQLIPPNSGLGLDEIVVDERIVVGRQTGSRHPVFQAGHEDIQDDIVVVSTVGTNSHEVTEGRHRPLQSGGGWTL